MATYNNKLRRLMSNLVQPEFTPHELTRMATHIPFHTTTDDDQPAGAPKVEETFYNPPMIDHRWNKFLVWSSGRITTRHYSMNHSSNLFCIRFTVPVPPTYLYDTISDQRLPLCDYVARSHGSGSSFPGRR